MTKKIARITAIVAVIAMFLIGWYLFYGTFPNNQDIDDSFNQYQQKETYQDKVDVLSGLLTRINNPQSVNDDQVVKYAFSKLTDMYKKDNNAAILEATENVNIDGGFANFMCEFYKRISSEKGFRERYFINNDGSHIKQCVGISFSLDEFNKLKNTQK